MTFPLSLVPAAFPQSYLLARYRLAVDLWVVHHFILPTLCEQSNSVNSCSLKSGLRIQILLFCVNTEQFILGQWWC